MEETRELHTMTAAEKVKQLADLLVESEKNGTWGQIDSSVLQQLAESVIKIYAMKMQELDRLSEMSKEFMPISKENTIPDTEAMIFADRLLQSKNLELFELQMFRNFC